MAKTWRFRKVLGPSAITPRTQQISKVVTPHMGLNIHLSSGQKAVHFSNMRAQHMNAEIQSSDYTFRQ
jgi:hypothetical protein